MSTLAETWMGRDRLQVNGFRNESANILKQLPQNSAARCTKHWIRRQIAPYIWRKTPGTQTYDSYLGDIPARNISIYANFLELHLSVTSYIHSLVYTVCVGRPYCGYIIITNFCSHYPESDSKQGNNPPSNSGLLPICHLADNFIFLLPIQISFKKFDIKLFAYLLLLFWTYHSHKTENNFLLVKNSRTSNNKFKNFYLKRRQWQVIKNNKRGWCATHVFRVF